MSLKIVERRIGDVTILDMAGTVSLGVGSVILRDKIVSLIDRGSKKIILNYSDVTYHDSSGNGELVSAFTRVVNAGGMLVLLHLRKRIKDLLQITKLYTVFEVFDDELAALRRLGGNATHALCPVCYGRGLPALLEGETWQPQVCSNPKCGAHFVLYPSDSHGQKHEIESVQISTYPDEYFEAVAGLPNRIKVVGRLNLFTSPGLDKLWGALPQQVALIDLRRATEVTAEGRDALVKLTVTNHFHDAFAVSLEGAINECAQMFAGNRHAYETDAAAMSALAGYTGERYGWAARFD